MDDYPAQIADFLESTATKVRGLTVDRVRVGVAWAAVGLVLAMLGFLALVFVLIALFRLLAEITTVEIAYAIVGGLFLIVGVLLWSKRNPSTEPGAVRAGEDVNV